MNRAAAMIGAIAGLLFVLVEIARLALAGPPPEHGTAAQIIGYATQHESILRLLFPFVDAVGAASLLVFALVVIQQKSGGDVEWLARIAAAGAVLILGVSLVLDGLLIAYINVATSPTPDGAPALFAAALGVESLFPYVIALFMIPTAALAIAAGSNWFGWAAAVIGASFLVSGLLPAIGVDVELEGPLFMLLLLWVVAGSITLLRSDAPVVRRNLAGAAA